MLFTSKSLADCFSTTPRAPRRMARTTSRSSSAAVSTITRVGSESKLTSSSTPRPSFSGMRKIQQKDVRLQLRKHFYAFGAVGSLADNLNFVGSLQQLAETITENGVVVRDQDANHLFSFRHFNSVGFLPSDAPRARDLIPPSASRPRPVFFP